MGNVPQTLRQKIKNHVALATAVWSMAILPAIPSYANMLFQDKTSTSQQNETLIEVAQSNRVIIRPPDIVKKGSALANGKDINTLKVIIRDTAGNAVPNTKVMFVLPPELKLANKKIASHSSAYNHIMQTSQAAKSTAEQKYEAKPIY